MRNRAELVWVICACAAVAFATFVLAFGAVAFVYWLLALIGMGV